MPTIDDQALRLAKVLWDYHCIPNKPTRADIILVLGSSDTRVAVEAAKLALDGLAQLLVISGGLGKVTAQDGGDTEAKRFAKVAEAMGVADNIILLEEAATNTGDNFVKSRSLLQSRGQTPQTAIFVTKPYMKRRALATALKQWPEVQWIPHAPPISFEQYPDQTVPAEQMIQLMVGDLQRISVYPAMGFQAEQFIPPEVWQAYRDLVALGFDRYVIKDKDH